MAQKYYNVKQAAEILGLSQDEVKQMQESRELHAYRDGADWKFKVEDIQQLAKQRAATPEEEDDVLLSEVELGQSDPGVSGTVIGMEGAGEPSADDEVDSKVSQFEELDLTLEEDLTLEDSQLASTRETPSAGSDIDLSGSDLEDDDLVLGGSGAGSDITIGGDSGISLVDPADSGISLEEPLDLTGSGTESLELGEDDMISLGEDANTDAPTELKTDDDFLLTPLEEAAEEEDSESGSQVIALDTEGEGDEAVTMIAGGAAAGSMAAMLEEDLSTQPAGEMGLGAPLDAAAPGMAPLGQADMALPEAPYSIWNVLSLALCAIFLVLSGMFMYDLMRNMWSWNGPFDVNSSMMDTVLSWFEK